MDFSLASFIAGIMGGGGILFYAQNRFPTFFPTSRESKLLEQIEILEDRLEKKDKLIRSAIKSVDKGNKNEN